MKKFIGIAFLVKACAVQLQIQFSQLKKSALSENNTHLLYHKSEFLKGNISCGKLLLLKCFNKSPQAIMQR